MIRNYVKNIFFCVTYKS